MTDAPRCKDCDNACQRDIWSFWSSAVHDCEGCAGKLCSACYHANPLLIHAKNGGNNLDEANLKNLCKDCFQVKSKLDFSRTYDEVPGSSGVTFVFVHGGSGSRAMFRAHAEALQQRYGHSSILLDLPGHGSLVETSLSLNSFQATIEHVLNSSTLATDKTKKKIYFGGSLGAYGGFHALSNLQQYFDGAVLVDCGQNVGPGASLKARIGLWFMSKMGATFSNTSMMQMMLNVTKKSPADYKLIDTVFGAGMFFDQTVEQVEVLKAVAPAEFIPTYNFPVLFMNGSLDYRDSENKWLSLCKDQRSELKVYEGGDHFFIHDSRFVDDIFERTEAFVQRIVDQK